MSSLDHPSYDIVAARTISSTKGEDKTDTIFSPAANRVHVISEHELTAMTKLLTRRSRAGSRLRRIGLNAGNAAVRRAILTGDR